MDAILGHPANECVIRSLCRLMGRAASVATPDSVRNPYLGCGSHPEIVERVWDQLGHGLSPDSRRIVCGVVVLVQPTTGVILAVAFGTSYSLRLPQGAFAAALEAGCTTSHRWGDGKTTDLSTLFGSDWVFGCWAKDEAAWCQAVVS
jgi:hypothetical protein